MKKWHLVLVLVAVLALSLYGVAYAVNGPIDPTNAVQLPQPTK